MLKPKLFIINNNYPNENNLYGDVFVHTRAKQYLNAFDVLVLGCNDELENDIKTEYEGIKILNLSSKERFNDYINNNPPDIIAIHFVKEWMFNIIKCFEGKIFIWIHGFEALGWYRRLFNYNLKKIKSLILNIIINTKQMFFMHNLIKYSNKNNKVYFIFVSNWMRKITQTDTLSFIRYYKIIPNPIDENLFLYEKKSIEHRKKLLLIRSFDSKKYANDIAIKAIQLLSREKYFSEFEFHIYGKGEDFFKLTDKIKHFSNVHLHNYYIENKEIPNIHKNFGIFLCPTRQDAQGVSMCEAMSSGLVPITSNNTAIPEYTNINCAFLTNSSFEIAKSINVLYNDEQLFLKMSENASEFITSISGVKLVVDKEINMMLEAMNK